MSGDVSDHAAAVRDAIEDWVPSGHTPTALASLDALRELHREEQARAADRLRDALVRLDTAEEALETVADWSATSAAEHGHVGVTEVARNFLADTKEPT